MDVHLYGIHAKTWFSLLNSKSFIGHVLIGEQLKVPTTRQTWQHQDKIHTWVANKANHHRHHNSTSNQQSHDIPENTAPCFVTEEPAHGEELHYPRWHGVHQALPSPTKQTPPQEGMVFTKALASLTRKTALPFPWDEELQESGDHFTTMLSSKTDIILQRSTKRQIHNTGYCSDIWTSWTIEEKKLPHTSQS